MASWDDEDFDPDEPKETAVTDKWEGEDEDENNIKDNWDDEEEKEATNVNTTSTDAQPKKKKKPIGERIKEKNEKKQQEMQKKAEEAKIVDEVKELTPEEALAERLRLQRLQEESDLELAKEAFGGPEALPGQKTLDSFEPTSKEDFQELSVMLAKKLSKYETKKEYGVFLENLFRDCCAGVDAEEIKRIANALNILASEKLKAQKGPKGGKKKSAKKGLAAGKAASKGDLEDMEGYDEYDDFM